jgi:subtilase family serine protease
MTSKAPSYNSGWAQEIALDTQWAHAIAPLARIVLIEAASATLSNLDGAIMLANTFGAGAVSMSFSASEGSWVNQAAYSTALFSKRGVSYFAATGDSGTSVGWPSVEPTVVGVGGTSLLNYNPTSRSERVWSGTGGGISAYVSMPSYQTSLTIPGEPAQGNLYRVVGDVSMDADPYTGVYVAFTAPRAGRASWYVFGGTSLSTPMWAAELTLANAGRASALSAPNALLYGYNNISFNYTSDFFDITSGSDGTCASCSAASGYDAPSGLGTPDSSALLSYLGTTAQ